MDNYWTAGDYWIGRFACYYFVFQHLVEGISSESNGWIYHLACYETRGVPVGMIVDARITAVKAGSL